VQFTTADTKVKTIIVSWCGVSRDDLEKIVNDWFYKMHKISRTIEKTDDYKLIINSSGD